MGLFDRFKNKKDINFNDIDSNEKAIKLSGKGILAPLYLIPLRFGGEESERNKLFVPPVIVELKDRFDDMVEELLVNNKVNGYSCIPEYKGNSFIPAVLNIEAKKDDKTVFSESINIWE